MALYDSLYNLDQAYIPPTNNMIRPSGARRTPMATPLSPFNSGGDPSFGKTLSGLGLSSLVATADIGPQPQPDFGERPAGASDQDWQRYTDAVVKQHQKRLDGDASRYIGTGEGSHKFQQFIGNTGLGDIGGGGSRMPFPEQQLNQYQSSLFGNPLNQQPSSTQPDALSRPSPTPMPTSTPMPGDVGYVPYGSRNNQLVPPGYEKPSFVQGLAGGGPIRNLSFVELLRQTMEN